jgi:hypothetical protein
MPKLNLILETGFNRDHVIIKVDDNPLCDLQAVTYRLLLGYAETLEIELPTGEHLIDIEIINRALHDQTRVQLEQETSLAISLSTGGMVWRNNPSNIGYL